MLLFILQATRVHQCGPCAAGSQSGKWRAISDASIDAHVETVDHEAAVADAADDAYDEGDDDDDDRFIRYLLATASFASYLSVIFMFYPPSSIGGLSGLFNLK